MDSILQSDRLVLRQWKEADRERFAAMNKDRDVMRYFPRRYTREESDRFIDENVQTIEQEGWGCWAVQLSSTGEFIGFVGFARPASWHPCAGEIEIGWRLASPYWGRGYATEAAKLALSVGFSSINFNQLVSFTSACNLPSIGVMKKIGMRDDMIGFEHPRISEESHLRKHVVYRLSQSEWIAGVGPW